MKKLAYLFFFLVSGFTVCMAQSDKAQRGTAEYFLQNPDRFLDKPLTVNILAASQSSAPAPEGYVSFLAQTSSAKGGINGGVILLYIRENNAEKFASKHKSGWLVGGVPQTTSVAGRFIKAVSGDGYAIRAN